MRILILSWRDPEHPFAGGAETYVDEIGRRWARAGHEVRWLCGRHPGQAREAERGGMLLRRQGGPYGVYPCTAWEYLLRHRGWADVVVDAENGIPFFSPFYSRAPKVVLMHHVHREVFHHELPPGAAHLGVFLEGRLMPWAYRNHWYVAVSRSTRDELLGLGVPAEQVAVIHNGLDDEIYRPGTEPKGDRPNALWVGRLQSYKKVSILVDAAIRCRTRRPELRWLVAGEGPELEPLRARIAAAGLEDVVQLLGYVDTERKVRLMQAAHVVVQTSMKEGWGMTVIEANACGTTVVASDVPGLRDSVQDRRTGRLVPCGDAEALADGVLRIVDQPDLRRRLEHEALEWAGRFRWDRSAEQWSKLLQARLVGGDVPAFLRWDCLPSLNEPIPQPAA